MRFGDDIGRDVLDELAFCLKGIFAVRRESKAFADTKDMGIDCHCGLVPNDRTDHVRGLTTDSLERLQVIDVIGNDAVVDFYQPLRHLYQMFRFGTGITDGLDVFKDFVRGGFREAFRRRVCGKEGRCDHIDPLVRALGGEHHRHKTLERIGEHQFALCDRHVGFKPR